MVKKVLLSFISLTIGATFVADEALVKEFSGLEKEKVLTLEVLVLAIYLFVSELVRVDVVGILMMVLLPLLGLVSPEKAIGGLSSNAVVSIIAVIIIGAGLDKTGVMNILAGYIIRFAGKSKTRIIALISGTVAIISSFMQNIGAAALFLPAVVRISKRLRVPVSHMLMPMGYFWVDLYFPEFRALRTRVSSFLQICLKPTKTYAVCMSFMYQSIFPKGV